MSYGTNPITDLAAALAHAQYQGFAEIRYQDRDWVKYRKWKEKIFDPLSREEKAILYQQERETGVPMEPADCRIEKTRRPDLQDMEVIAMFSQTWGSTALGFGGIGGAAMTSAYTIVLRCGTECAVYFGGMHAYTVDHPNDLFYEDISKRWMREVSAHRKYCKK
jgi:hypothetical protein